MSSPRISTLTGWLLRLFILAAGLAFLGSITTSLFDAPALRRDDDFGILWGSAYLHRMGGNPYSPLELNRVLQDIGHAPVAEDAVALMWYAPYAFTGLLPFALLPYPIARALWFWLGMIALAACFTWIWKTYMGSPSGSWIAWVLGFFFLPTLMTLLKGQIGWLILLGLVGLMASLNRRSPIGAGLALLPLLLKPHLIYLILLIFLLWAWRQRFRSALVISALGFGIATIISWLINPNILHNYVEALRHYAPLGWATPTTGFLLRSNQVWLSFLPVIPGAIWATFQWLSHRQRWSWGNELPRLILISTLTAPYGWSFDWVVLTWPLLQVFIRLIQIKSIFSLLFIIIYAIVDLTGLLTYILPIRMLLGTSSRSGCRGRCF